jgi:hypothetical protein
LRYKARLLRQAAEGATPYQYSPLNEGAQEIRLMTLFPETVSSEIRVSLEIVPFTKDHVHDFEALSYAWGSAENLVDIIIGASGHEVVSITQNLAEALPYLRYEDRSRVLWIDAICVNQQDLEERSRQVERMADIFTKASRVVVWLGPESSDSSVAIDCFHTISENVEVDQVTLSARSLSNETHWEETHVPIPFSDTQYWSIYRLLQRSWFEHLWIWQEVRLGSRNTVVKCGTKEILWRSVYTTIFCLYTKCKPPDFLIPELLSSERRVYALCNEKQKTNFIDLIRQTQECLCSDPRDRVFAILSLLTPPHDNIIRIKPDYSKSVHEVYTETAIHYFEQYQRLKLLEIVEDHNQFQHLPSWVLDFRTPRLATPLDGPLMCAGRSAAVTNIVKKQRLRITGLRIATIERIEGFGNYRGPSAYFTLERDLKRIESVFWGKESYTYDKQQFEAFCRTIFHNRFYEMYDPPVTFLPSMKQCERFLSVALGHVSPSDASPHRLEHSKVQTDLFASIQGRSVFKTAEGNFGLAPKAAMVGDVVVIVLGCTSAMIFRPVRKDTYQVIGEAYLHGFMECQALLGPLPDPFEYVCHYNEPDNTSWTVCFNRKTGLVQVEDPRLGPLPEHVRTMPVLY